jgi:hypothetical protein
MIQIKNRQIDIELRKMLEYYEIKAGLTAAVNPA